MRAGQCVDAVDLDEPKILKHAVQVFSPAGSGAGGQQQVPDQKNAAGALVVQQGTAHSVTLSPMRRRQFKDRFGARAAVAIPFGKTLLPTRCRHQRAFKTVAQPVALAPRVRRRAA
jgi:hypothetical protein